jgi:heme-degrading monooxygenase HmoA
MPTTTTLTRITTVRSPDDWEKRVAGLLARLDPFLKSQPGFVDHSLTRDGDQGRMVQTVTWATPEDCTRYIRGGAAAMAATWIDAFLPTAPYPNGNWLRETVTT